MTLADRMRETLRPTNSITAVPKPEAARPAHSKTQEESERSSEEFAAPSSASHSTSSKSSISSSTSSATSGPTAALKDTIERPGKTSKQPAYTTEPESISKNYYVEDKSNERRYFDDYQRKALAFRATDTAVSSRREDLNTIRAMLEVTQARGWQTLQLQGSTAFKREAWIEATARGLQAHGFPATDVERQEADRRRTERQPVNEVRAAAGPAQQTSKAPIPKTQASDVPKVIEEPKLSGTTKTPASIQKEKAASKFPTSPTPASAIPPRAPVRPDLFEVSAAPVPAGEASKAPTQKKTSGVPKAAKAAKAIKPPKASDKKDTPSASPKATLPTPTSPNPVSPTPPHTPISPGLFEVSAATSPTLETSKTSPKTPEALEVFKGQKVSDPPKISSADNKAAQPTATTSTPALPIPLRAPVNPDLLKDRKTLREASSELSVDGRLVLAALSEKIDRQMQRITTESKAELKAFVVTELIKKERTEGPVVLSTDQKRQAMAPEPKTTQSMPGSPGHGPSQSLQPSSAVNENPAPVIHRDEPPSPQRALRR